MFQAEFFDDNKYSEDYEPKQKDKSQSSDVFAPPTSLAYTQRDEEKKIIAETHLRGDIVSKSTTESTVTTVVSTLTKSSEEDQKSVVEECTSGELSKISDADLIKDQSKTSIETKEEEHTEDRGTPDLSKKSLDLTKDYSKSSMDSKDTSRDFATNELSKDSTVDLSKEYSKASVESVKETSKSLDEKTFSEDHSSLDVSKTLASDASDGITASKEFLEEETRSISKLVKVSTSSSRETSVFTESKVYSEHDDQLNTSDKIEKDVVGEIEEKIQELKSEFKKEEAMAKETVKDKKLKEAKRNLEDESVKDEEQDQVPDITELNRRCSNLLEDISQGALIRIDSSHVTHGKNFYKILAFVRDFVSV